MRKGFTLIELSIVLTILGLVLGGALGMYRVQMKANYNKVTAQRIDDVRKGLFSYYYRKGVLPCVADPALGRDDPQLGQPVDCKEAPKDGTVRTTENSVRLKDKTLSEEQARVRIGAVPVRALGLPAEDMHEPNGALFLYAVTESLTQKAPPPDQSKGAIDIVSPVTGKSVLTATPNGAGSALYVLIDPAADGKKPPPCDKAAAPPADYENCNGDTVFSE